MSIDTSVGRVEGVRVSIDTSVQVSGQGSGYVALWTLAPSARCACATYLPAARGEVWPRDLPTYLPALGVDRVVVVGSCTGLGHRGCVVADAVVVQQEAAELLAAHAEAERRHGGGGGAPTPRLARAYLPYGKPPSVRARSRARRGAAPRRHRRPTYLHPLWQPLARELPTYLRKATQQISPYFNPTYTRTLLLLLES